MFLNTNNILTFLITLQILLVNGAVWSQNKKEQIEILNNRVDSLINLNREITSQLNKQAIDITNLKSELSKLEVENSKKDNAINELLEKIKKANKELEIILMKVDLEVVSPPSFSISDSKLIEIVDGHMKDACPQFDIHLESGPDICKKAVSKITYFQKGNTFRFFACIGYSYDGSHYDSGKNGFILAEYQNNAWEVLDFMQFDLEDGEGNFGDALEISDEFKFGKNSYGYFAQHCRGENGYEHCNGFIIGFYCNKIDIFLNNLDSADNHASGELPIESWSYTCRVIPSKEEQFSIERIYHEINGYEHSEILNFNVQSRKYE